MSLDKSRWRTPSNYDYTDDLNAPDVGWEWLRRNEDYQNDFDALQTAPTHTPALIERASLRWGLRFRSPAEPQRH